MRKMVSMLLILLFLLPFFGCADKEPPQLVPPPEEVSSVTIWWSSPNVTKKAKEISGQEDIAAFLQRMNSAESHGSYTHLPSGGQTFSMILNLRDNTAFSCMYYQSGASDGYYTDGTVKLRISSLDLKTAWEELPYPELSDDPP